MKKILLFCFALFRCADSRAQSIRMPAEWEHQEKVILSLQGHSRRDTISYQIIEALQPHVRISLYISDHSMRTETCRRLSKYKVDTAAINFLVDPYADFWTRDHFSFVKDSGKIKVVCFNWTYYGRYPDLIPRPISLTEQRFGQFDERLANDLRLQVIKSEFVFEGGGIETNGSGTFLIIREMALQRNPGKSITEIEMELKRTLGARKIIWLKNGLAEDKVYKDGGLYKNYFGGGANMHVDELARFVNDTTVVLPYIGKNEKDKSPVDSINYDMLEANYQILKNATTADGKQLTVVRIPMPEAELLKTVLRVDSSRYKSVRQYRLNIGDSIFLVPAASYCNYFVSNQVVLVQQYWKPGMPESQRRKDEESLEIFKKVFPGRKLVTIYPISINKDGGGIHCMTHEQPSGQ